MTRPLTAEEITQQWGERCPEFSEGCPCCQMWAMHDAISTARRTALLEAAEIADHYAQNCLHAEWPDDARGAGYYVCGDIAADLRKKAEADQC